MVVGSRPTASEKIVPRFPFDLCCCDEKIHFQFLAACDGSKEVDIVQTLQEPLLDHVVKRFLCQLEETIVLLIEDR